jgi:hypothetical protein
MRPGLFSFVSGTQPECVKRVTARRQPHSRPDDRRISCAATGETSYRRAISCRSRRVLALASRGPLRPLPGANIARNRVCSGAHLTGQDSQGVALRAGGSKLPAFISMTGSQPAEPYGLSQRLSADLPIWRRRNQPTASQGSTPPTFRSQESELDPRRASRRGSEPARRGSRPACR